MKRDYDLIRELLRITEDSDEPVKVWTIKINGIREAAIHYHVCLLQEAGFIKANAEDMRDGTVEATLIYRLTWQGHEFYDAIRDDNLWQKVKNIIIKQEGKVPADVLRDVAMRMLEAKPGG